MNPTHAMTAIATLTLLATTACQNPLANPDFAISNQTTEELVVLTTNESGGTGTTPVGPESGSVISTQGCNPGDITIEYTDGRTLTTLEDKQICPGGTLIIKPDYTVVLRENA
jgi:hypothetical protein